MFIGDEIKILDTVDSTNEYVRRNNSTLPHGAIVVSELQTSGRGRFSRKWISNIKGNLYYSIILKDTSWLEMSTHLPIFTVVILRQAIVEAMGPGYEQIGFKWPNDIRVLGGKLGGILIDSDDGFFIIGIGLNLVKSPEIKNVKVSCLADTGADNIAKPLDFIKVFKDVFNRGIERYNEAGFSYFMDEWERYCIHLNKNVDLNEGIEDNTQKKEVFFKGLNDDGGAMVTLADTGEEKVIYYGELDI